VTDGEDICRCLQHLVAADAPGIFHHSCDRHWRQDRLPTPPPRGTRRISSVRPSAKTVAIASHGRRLDRSRRLSALPFAPVLGEAVEQSCRESEFGGRHDGPSSTAVLHSLDVGGPMYRRLGAVAGCRSGTPAAYACRAVVSLRRRVNLARLPRDRDRPVSVRTSRSRGWLPTSALYADAATTCSGARVCSILHSSSGFPALSPNCGWPTTNMVSIEGCTSGMGLSKRSTTRALWRVLALVSVPGSIHYRVLPGLLRDDLISNPQLAPADETGTWWRLSAAPAPVR
jgi:hypothetical protein